MKTIEESVLETINYAKKYQSGLDFSRLWYRLYSPKVVSKKLLKSVISQKKIKITKLNISETKAKEQKAIWLTNKYLKNFDDILMVAITGSVAADNAKKSDDIDLLIVCKQHSLWIMRLKLRFLIWIKNIPHRKFGQREKADEFCFNMWLCRESLQLPKIKRNKKNALDLIMMKVIYDREKIYGRMIQENRWAKKYVANGYSTLNKSNKIRKGENVKINNLKKWFNMVCFWGQYFYMSFKPNRKLVSLNSAFFHEK